MAVEWSCYEQDRKYEIRTAGNSVRLYTNGVFHSQYNHKMKTCNGIWDLLALPLFLVDSSLVKRILVLGVGGGAVIKILQDYFSVEKIVGIELNPIHIYIAKRYFKVNRKNVELVEAEARHWVENQCTEKFDLIIEDLFTEVDGEPSRAIKFDSGWLQSLKNCLSNHGLLIANFISSEELHTSALFRQRRNICSQSTITMYADKRYDNQIVTVCPRTIQKNFPGPGKFAIATREQMKQYIPGVLLKNYEQLVCQRICK